MSEKYLGWLHCRIFEKDSIFWVDKISPLCSNVQQVSIKQNKELSRKCDYTVWLCHSYRDFETTSQDSKMAYGIYISNSDWQNCKVSKFIIFISLVLMKYNWQAKL